MAKNILTSKQSQFLELVSNEPKIVSTFYWTGGTALAQIYLQHRLSLDIDLFTEKEEVSQNSIRIYLRKVSSKLGIKNIEEVNFLGLYSFYLNYDDGTKLKVDFNYYPFPQIAKGQHLNKLKIDSLYDIATNKLHTIYMNPRPRDYIDLYLILKREAYSFDKLILDAKAKFDWHIDPVSLASQFMRVKDLSMKEEPKMLVPFDQNDLENYFLKLAKQLDSKILK